MEEKKIILFKLEEAFKKKDASSVKNMSNISYIFKEANGSESLDADVLFIENEELFMKTRKLSHLELCKVTSQRQLNKLCKYIAALFKIVEISTLSFFQTLLIA